MILHMGVRTTNPLTVAYKHLEPGEDEASAVAELLSTLASRGGLHFNMYDHSIIVHYDPPGKPNSRRELLIPVTSEVEGIATKVFPSVKAAFLVFKYTDTTLEEYYEQLRRYMEYAGLEPSGDFSRIEIMYVPEDLDEQDYTLEIMIPLAS